MSEILRLITRRLALLPLVLPLLLAACGGGEPAAPTVFAPLRYDYLTRLQLNVGSIEIQNRFAPRSAADVEQLSPVPPAQALEQMARDRLAAAGSTGRAVFVIDDASIVQNGNAYSGSLAVHLDIIGANGQRTGYAEARVARTRTGGTGDESQAAVLYALTKQMMDSMNVEFEYQVKRSLGDFLLTPSATPGGLATPVQQQPLGAPGAPPPAPPAPVLPATPAPSSLAPSGPSTLAPPAPVTPAAPAPQSYAPSYPAAPGYTPAPATPQTYAPPSYAPQTYAPPSYAPPGSAPAEPYAPAPAPQGY